MPFEYTTIGPKIRTDPAGAAADLKKLLDPPAEGGAGGEGLTCGEAGKRLGVGPRTIVRWVRMLRDKGFAFTLKEGRRPGSQKRAQAPIAEKPRAKRRKRRASKKVVAN